MHGGRGNKLAGQKVMETTVKPPWMWTLRKGEQTASCPPMNIWDGYRERADGSLELTTDFTEIGLVPKDSDNEEAWPGDVR